MNLAIILLMNKAGDISREEYEAMVKDIVLDKVPALLVTWVGLGKLATVDTFGTVEDW